MNESRNNQGDGLNQPCTHWRNQIDALWEKDPSHAEMEALVDHLATCEDCRSVWEARRWAEESSAELWQMSPAINAVQGDGEADEEVGGNDR